MIKASKILFFILLLIAEVLLPQSERNKIEPQVIYVGFSINMFNQVDVKDASVAIQLWGKELLGSLGINNSLETKVYENNNDIITDLKQNKLDLISILTTDYFEISKKLDVEPYFINSNNGKYGYSFLLLVRKDSGLKSLADLKNKRIIITSDTFSQLITMWLETTLYDKEQKFSEFFSEFKEVDKSSRALLQVFFNQTDACILPEESFETISELNPQLKNELIIIEKSPEYVATIMCLNKNIKKSVKKATLDAAQNLTTTISGMQLTSLFKSDGFLMYKPEHLKSTLDLYDKYNKIKN